MRFPFLGLLLVASLSSCLKDELPVPKQPRGEALTMTTCMGTGYQDQLWVDLSTASVSSTNAYAAWDLAFESAPDGWHVYLNGAKKMMVLNKGVVDITQPHDSAGMAAQGRIDAPSGVPDSTAFGDWRGTQDVYVVDLGLNYLGQAQGLRKVRFIAVSDSEYRFELARLDGSQLSTITVPKDHSRIFTCYKIGGSVVPIEPLRTNWDLVVTKYTHQFYEPYMPYLVSGMLSANGVRVAVVPQAELESVSLADTLAHPFSTARNAIGYDWKYYSFESASYIVNRTKVYIVQDAEGAFFKLHFVDFYNQQGRPGCPQFEVVALP